METDKKRTYVSLSVVRFPFMLAVAGSLALWSWQPAVANAVTPWIEAESAQAIAVSQDEAINGSVADAPPISETAVPDAFSYELAAPPTFAEQQSTAAIHDDDILDSVSDDSFMLDEEASALENENRELIACASSIPEEAGLDDELSSSVLSDFGGIGGEEGEADIVQACPLPADDLAATGFEGDEAAAARAASVADKFLAQHPELASEYGEPFARLSPAQILVLFGDELSSDAGDEAASESDDDPLAGLSLEERAALEGSELISTPTAPKRGATKVPSKLAQNMKAYNESQLKLFAALLKSDAKKDTQGNVLTFPTWTLALKLAFEGATKEKDSGDTSVYDTLRTKLPYLEDNDMLKRITAVGHAERTKAGGKYAGLTADMGWGMLIGDEYQFFKLTVASSKTRWTTGFVPLMSKLSTQLELNRFFESSDRDLKSTAKEMNDDIIPLLRAPYGAKVKPKGPHPQLISDVDLQNLVFMSIGTATFRGSFDQAFEPVGKECTVTFKSGGKSVSIPFVTRQTKAPYYSNGKLAATKVFMTGGEAVLIRAADKNKDVRDVLGADPAKAINDVLNAKFREKTVDLTVPTFKALKSEHNLVDAAKVALGLGDLFSEKKDGFRRLLNNKGVSASLTRIVQAAELTWTKNGFEATSTALVMAHGKGGIGSTVTMVLDREYLIIFRAKKTDDAEQPILGIADIRSLG